MHVRVGVHVLATTTVLVCHHILMPRPLCVYPPVVCATRRIRGGCLALQRWDFVAYTLHGYNMCVPGLLHVFEHVCGADLLCMGYRAYDPGKGPSSYLISSQLSLSSNQWSVGSMQ